MRTWNQGQQEEQYELILVVVVVKTVLLLSARNSQGPSASPRRSKSRSRSPLCLRRVDPCQVQALRMPQTAGSMHEHLLCAGTSGERGVERRGGAGARSAIGRVLIFVPIASVRARRRRRPTRTERAGGISATVALPQPPPRRQSCDATDDSATSHSETLGSSFSRRLYILCWRELSRRRPLPAVSPAAGHLTTPTVVGLPGLCENFRPTTSKTSPI